MTQDHAQLVERLRRDPASLSMREIWQAAEAIESLSLSRETIRREEREVVVEWLRAEAMGQFDRGAAYMAQATNIAAKAIERGDHLKGEGE